MGAHGLAETLALGFSFFAASVVASLIIYFFSNPTRRDLVITGAGAVAMALYFGLAGEPHMRVIGFGCYWGFFAFLYTFVQAGMEKTGRRRMPTLEAMILVPTTVLGMLPASALVAFFTIETWDYYLYAIDWAYGYPPSFWAGQLVQNNFWLRVICEFSYLNLPGALVLLWSLERRRDPLRARQILVCTMTLAACGVALYYVCPGVGAVVVFKEKFPDVAPPISVVPVLQMHPINFPRNCLPSLHTSWCLTILLYAFQRPARLLERVGWTVLSIFTLMYALSCGHYMADMFAAMPFFLAIYFVSRRAEWPSRQAFWPVVSGLAGFYLAWVAFLRFGQSVYSMTPLIPWGVSVATVALTLVAMRWFHARLVPAEEPAEAGQGALSPAAV